jgi:hypothetical protein
MMNCMYVTMGESNITAYIWDSFTSSQGGLLRVISLQYRFSFTSFSLGLHYVMQIYISHSFQYEKLMLFKRKVNEPPGYNTNVIDTRD